MLIQNCQYCRQLLRSVKTLGQSIRLLPRPGLAATLCQLALSGEVRNVYIGDTLGKLLEALFRQELGTESLDLLSVVALGGDSGITIQDIAEVLHISECKVQY